MAQSRLERIGTIYSRTKSLLRGGAMKAEDKPLWYDIYEAFPPKVEPRFDRPPSRIPIREIFYKEDVVRARFQKEYKSVLSMINLHSKDKTRTQQFLAIYTDLEKQGVPEEKLYEQAVESYMSEADEKKSIVESNVENDVEDKKEKTTVNIKKLFTD